MEAFWPFMPCTPWPSNLLMTLIGYPRVWGGSVLIEVIWPETHADSRRQQCSSLPVAGGALKSRQPGAPLAKSQLPLASGHVCEMDIIDNDDLSRVDNRVREVEHLKGPAQPRCLIWPQLITFPFSSVFILRTRRAGGLSLALPFQLPG